MSFVARIGVAVVALVFVMMVGGVRDAAASTPTPVSGTFQYGNANYGNPTLAGGNVIVSVTCPVSYTGTLSGTGFVWGTVILHADGSANFQEVGTFTGTVNGTAGSLTFTIDGSGRGSSTVVFLSHDVIVGGTGALAGLSGVINLVGVIPEEGNGNPLGNYSGQIEGAS